MAGCETSGKGTMPYLFFLVIDFPDKMFSVNTKLIWGV